MKLTIVSNYINHHQIPLANALAKQADMDFAFIQTQQMEEDRVKMGWGKEVSQIPYLQLYYETPEVCAKRIMDSDIVIFGGVEDESYIKPRLDAGKIVIRSSERLYREGQWKAISPRGLKKKFEDHTQYADAPVYLLCNGAYVASDFDIVKAYPGKKFVWGYFPKVKEYQLDSLFFRKKRFNENGEPMVRILWAGRYLKLKHPEYAIYVARDLKKKQIPFHLDMIGGGELEEKLHALVKKYQLEKEVIFHGFQEPANVRCYMEEADIFLFTSNYLEGWGAVLNESMNSACAVVAGHGIGAVPYLIKDGYNGMVYRTGNYRECLDKVITVATDEKLRKKLAIHAYETMTTMWKPEIAADRLTQFCKGLLEDKWIVQEDGGPMSLASNISPRKGYEYTKRDRKQ